MVHLTALGLKWLVAFAVLLFLGLAFAPAPGHAALVALIVAITGWLVDRLIPFRFQGVTRWAVDSGVAGLAIYFGQFLWPGGDVPFWAAVLTGFVIGSVELPIHHFLAARFGVNRKKDGWGGIG